MKIVFWIDPIHTLNLSKDTSYVLMLGAQEREHQVFIVYQQDIHCQKGNLYFHCQQIQISPKQKNPIQITQKTTLQEKDIGCLFIRKDPPFDKNYLETTWLLDIIAKRVLVVNSPSGIRNASEKIWANQLPQLSEFIPDTLITSSKSKFLSFLTKHPKVILKPTDGFSGKSVFLISKEDTNAMVSFETLSHGEKQRIVIQQYIEASVHGDKRVFILDGEIIGQFLKKHSAHDHRNNLAAGGKPIACGLTNTDKKIAAKLRPHLLQCGLPFVGLDIIGEYLIEINVTSPTGLQEMNTLYNVKKHHEVIEYCEKASQAFPQL